MALSLATRRAALIVAQNRGDLLRLIPNPADGQVAAQLDTLLVYQWDRATAQWVSVSAWPGVGAGYLLSGEGSPEGVVPGEVSQIYGQQDGPPGGVLWVKQTGSGNTGWRPMAVADHRANATKLLTALTRDADDAVMMLVSDSTGTASYPWFLSCMTAFAALFPRYTVTFRYWNSGTNAYDAPTTLQVGTGSHTLSIYNASIGGALTTRFLGTNYPAMIQTPNPQYCFISLGHNEAPTIANWGPTYHELVASLLRALPACSFCVIAQNPETGTDIQAQRAQVYEEIAALYGFGYIDAHQAFEDNGGPSVLNNPDGVHPNALGQAVWAACVLQALQNDRLALTLPSGFPWMNAGEELLSNGDFSAWDSTLPQGWSVTGGAVVTKDVVNYESPNFYAAKVTAAGTTGTMSQTLNAKRLAGNWLTVLARVYVASGQPDTCGKLGVSDGVTGATSSRNTAEAQGVFRWKVWQQYIDPTAASVTIFLYGDGGGAGATGEATFDRVSARIGKVPMLGLLKGAVALDRVQPGTGPSGTYLFGRSDGSTVNVGVNGPSGVARSFKWLTAGVSRWFAQATSTAEGGANAGSDLRIIASDDTGATIDNPVEITRAAGGPITVTRPVTVGGAVTATIGSVTSGASALAAAAQFILNALAGQARSLVFRSAGVTRWFVQVDSTAESGSDAGSDFNIIARNDAGGAIDTPLKIARAAGGNITISRPLVGVTAAAHANSTVMATTAYVDRVPAILNGTPADPTGTTDTATGKMMGLAQTITPTKTGVVKVLVTGQMANNTLGDSVTVELRTGTGAAPANGDAPTGTARGNPQTQTAVVAAQRGGFTLAYTLSGAVLGTPIWIDVRVQAGVGGTAAISGVTVNAQEG